MSEANSLLVLYNFLQVITGIVVGKFSVHSFPDKKSELLIQTQDLSIVIYCSKLLDMLMATLVNLSTKIYYTFTLKLRKSQIPMYESIHITCYMHHCSVDPGTERFKFTFTMRDSPSDYINATCWGSEEYIKRLHGSFKICDVGEFL